MCEKELLDTFLALEIDKKNSSNRLSSVQCNLREKLLERVSNLPATEQGSSPDQALSQLLTAYSFQLWHCMLFSYFLAENNLLTDSKNGVVTIKDCTRLALDQETDRWQFVFRLVYAMFPPSINFCNLMPQIPVSKSLYCQLEELLNSLPKPIFQTTDALGWAYQFWQQRKKASINRSNSKVDASDLAPATQLFTEPYMVKFLLHNFLGSWWYQNRPNVDCPVDFSYLKHSPENLHLRYPTLETSKNLQDVQIIDPCCGTGHFLVELFLMLVPMRMTTENISATHAIDAVLKENIHGLELDSNCLIVATFALSFEAWRYPEGGGFRRLPELNLACCGQPVIGSKQQWRKYVEGNSSLEAGMEAFYEMFSDAPILGSLMDPTQLICADILLGDIAELDSTFKNFLTDNTSDTEDQELSVRNLSKLYALLSREYDAIVTNVPYLGREKQTLKLREYCDTYYPRSKQDLATVFLERTLKMCVSNGEILVVMPQNFLFLSRYKHLREYLLTNFTWKTLGVLGSRAFESISGEVVKTCLVQIQRVPPVTDPQNIAWIDVSDGKTPQQKSEFLKHSNVDTVSQKQQLSNSDYVIGGVNDEDQVLLEEFAYCYQGLATSDNAQFVFRFWEVETVSNGWEYFQFAPSRTAPVSGCSHILLWENANGRYSRHALALKKEGRLGGWKSGQGAWGKQGIAINRMSGLPVSFYFGTKFDCNVAALVPRDQADLPAMWEYCASETYNQEVRKLNRKLSVTNSTLAKVPFDKSVWSRIARKKGGDSFSIETDDPTQWMFHGHPKYSTAPLQVCVARLLGYHWPAESNPALLRASRSRQLLEEVKRTLGPEVSTGIACIPPLCGEPSAADRLTTLLNLFFGDSWTDILEQSLNQEHFWPDLDEWLRKYFFLEHCKLFHHRPFIWHIWDGLEGDGFHALINYHRLVQNSTEVHSVMDLLITKYLKEWICQQEQGIAQSEHGAKRRHDAAIRLKEKLEAILTGAPPYDIFVRWKSLRDQPIGWRPDLNDGIRVNIRPFMMPEDSTSEKGTGVLRVNPNINWTVDRGKEPMREKHQFPWFWSGDSFTGVRVNDVHIDPNLKVKTSCQ